MEFRSSSLGGYERGILPVLRAALLETDRVRPQDPVEYMANLLFRFAREGGVPDHLGDDLIVPPTPAYSPAVQNLPPLDDSMGQPQSVTETRYSSEPQRVSPPAVEPPRGPQSVEINEPTVMTRWVVGRPSELSFTLTNFRAGDRLRISLHDASIAAPEDDHLYTLYEGIPAVDDSPDTVRHTDGAITRKLFWTPSTRIHSGNTYYLTIADAVTRRVYASSTRFYIQGRSLNVLKPTSKDSWEVGVPQMISWRADNFLNGERVNVYLVHAGQQGGARFPIFESCEVHQHNNDPVTTVSWTPPSNVVSSWDCMIVVESTVDSSIRSVSEPFGVHAPRRNPTILIHSPSPTSTWTVGDHEEVRFSVVDFKPGQRVRFVLRSWNEPSGEEREIAVVSADSISNNVQRVLYRIPETTRPGPNYFVHAVCTDDPRIRADSVEFRVRPSETDRTSPQMTRQLQPAPAVARAPSPGEPRSLPANDAPPVQAYGRPQPQYASAAPVRAPQPSRPSPERAYHSTMAAPRNQYSAESSLRAGASRDISYGDGGGQPAAIPAAASPPRVSQSYQSRPGYTPGPSSAPRTVSYQNPRPVSQASPHAAPVATRTWGAGSRASGNYVDVD